MKRFNPETMIMAVITGVLFLLLGTFAPTYAQHDQKQKGKDQQEQPQARDRQEQQQQPQAKDRKEQQQQPQAKDRQEQQQQPQAKDRQEQQKQQAKVQQDQQSQQAAKSLQKRQTQQEPKAQQTQQATGLKKQQQQAPQLSQKAQPVQQSEQRNVWQQDRASSWQTEHRTWQQRGGYTGYRIPENHFRGYFGRDHGFRIYNRSLEIFGGHPRFQYEGYWFCVVDPWPEYWSAYWYENDDVYIDYVGGGYYMYNRRYPRDRIAITVYVG
jgi:primosomal protein N'